MRADTGICVSSIRFRTMNADVCCHPEVPTEFFQRKRSNTAISMCIYPIALNMLWLHHNIKLNRVLHVVSVLWVYNIPGGCEVCCRAGSGASTTGEMRRKAPEENYCAYVICVDHDKSSGKQITQRRTIDTTRGLLTHTIPLIYRKTDHHSLYCSSHSETPSSRQSH